jgi:hypothetical protein
MLSEGQSTKFCAQKSIAVVNRSQPTLVEAGAYSQRISRPLIGRPVMSSIIEWPIGRRLYPRTRAASLD